MTVEGATLRECSKVESTKSTQAAAKSKAAAGIDAELPTLMFVALANKTASCIAANAESSTYVDLVRHVELNQKANQFCVSIERR